MTDGGHYICTKTYLLVGFSRSAGYSYQYVCDGDHFIAMQGFEARELSRQISFYQQNKVAYLRSPVL